MLNERRDEDVPVESLKSKVEELKMIEIEFAVVETFDSESDEFIAGFDFMENQISHSEYYPIRIEYEKEIPLPQPLTLNRQLSTNFSIPFRPPPFKKDDREGFFISVTRTDNLKPSTENSFDSRR